MRSIIDVPRVFLRASAVDWAIDWRGQSAGEDTGGGDQVVVSGFPRFVGNLPLVLPRAMVGHYRALILRMQGRVNALRVPMIDPVSFQAGGAPWQAHWRAYLSGQYVEPRPKVLTVAASSAGAPSVTVDERPLARQIPVGAFLSYNDWPFAVVARSGPVEARVLTVQRLAVAIPSGAEIDLAARGVFLLPSGLSAQPGYGVTGPSQPELSLTEWITR